MGLPLRPSVVELAPLWGWLSLRSGRAVYSRWSSNWRPYRGWLSWLAGLLGPALPSAVWSAASPPHYPSLSRVASLLWGALRPLVQRYKKTQGHPEKMSLRFAGGAAAAGKSQIEVLSLLSFDLISCYSSLFFAAIARAMPLKNALTSLKFLSKNGRSAELPFGLAMWKGGR